MSSSQVISTLLQRRTGYLYDTLTTVREGSPDIPCKISLDIECYDLHGSNMIRERYGKKENNGIFQKEYS